MSEAIDALRYPIGKFTRPEVLNMEAYQAWIHDIESLPGQLKYICNDLTDEQLQKTYRQDSWTVAEVVHHIADSHMNSLVRYKWTLTEDTPIIKAYDQGAWSTLPDYKASVDVSLTLIEALHRRWVILLKSLTEEDFDKAYIHPETKKQVTLGINTSLYAWHGKHHVKHIEIALES